MKEDRMFSREELQDVCRRATLRAETKGVNPDWASTYRRLAEAADELDRRMDRSTLWEEGYGERLEGCLWIRFTEHEVPPPRSWEPWSP